MTIIKRNDTSCELPVLLRCHLSLFSSPTLLIVGMRNVESDWSATGHTQKLTNQSGEQIQVVNPEPAFDCTAESSELYPGVEF